MSFGVDGVASSSGLNHSGDVGEAIPLKSYEFPFGGVPCTIPNLQLQVSSNLVDNDDIGNFN